MTHKKQNYLNSIYTYCLILITALCLISTGCTTTGKKTSMPSGTQDIVKEKDIINYIQKAEPLIEELTGKKYKKDKAEYKIITRNDLKDLLFEEELPGQLRLKHGMGEDLIKRELEVSTQQRSQNYITRYSNLKDTLYIIPENIEPIRNIYEIKDEELGDYVFLLIAHEMVHYIDETHYDFIAQLGKCDGNEAVSAFGAVIDGSAAYVTKQIAERLNISDRIYTIASKSSLTIKDETSGAGKHYYDLYIVNGARFMKTVIDKKGTEGFNTAFLTPPKSTRQVLFPNEYLNPVAAAGIDCKALLNKIKSKMPLEGTRSNVQTLGTSLLQSSLTLQGIDQETSAKVAEGLLNGVALTGIKVAVKPTIITVQLLDFKTPEDSANFDSVSLKIQESKQSQVKASLNTEYNILKDEQITQDGFDLIRYRETEVKAANDEAVTKEVTAIIDGTYIVIGYVNVQDKTRQDMMDVLDTIYSEHSKMKQAGI